MTPQPLTTAHLTLVPASAEHLRAELAGPLEFAAILEVSVPESWPPGEYDADAQAFFLQKLLTAGQAGVGWYGWYAIRPADESIPATVVACGGYLGPAAADGTIEIGYSVCPEWRGRGYATELAAALTSHALGRPEILRVIAHTVASNPASVRVLEHCGFTPAGSGTEPGSLRFEHLRPAGP